jgi:hypothetical protein
MTKIQIIFVYVIRNWSLGIVWNLACLREVSPWRDEGRCLEIGASPVPFGTFATPFFKELNVTPLSFSLYLFP